MVKKSNLKMSEFFLEVFTEEIPAKLQNDARNYLFYKGNLRLKTNEILFETNISKKLKNSINYCQTSTLTH